MDAQIAVVVFGLIVVAVAAFQVGRGQTITGMSEVSKKLYTAAHVVAQYAPAADQLVKLGELEKDERLEYVIGMVLSFVHGLDLEQIRGVVEAWVVENKEEKKGSFGFVGAE